MALNDKCSSDKAVCWHCVLDMGVSGSVFYIWLSVDSVLDMAVNDKCVSNMAVSWQCVLNTAFSWLCISYGSQLTVCIRRGCYWQMICVSVDTVFQILVLVDSAY